MKIPTSAILLPLFLTTATNAWELTVWLNNGKHVTAHGTRNSGCVTYDFDMNSPVKRAKFKESTFADTFELYEKEKCGGRVSYRENGGDYQIVPPRIIKSYKVY
ncbi:hypothetical protein COCVIDRAFT_20584 [Bipolaris victoriae FI3]|uniref:Uncharacterized protein n=2 Tax=Bipolaris TaxID=33194 RepID=W6YFE2_COCC2|nr:uncharacterized protein COCCADRAFT_2536 [Bipolaris zeicola 26-R-13]XP_014551089.1 hypothetical protein COCVIDRAFT_20584 [Bipolaris victoriae FI3]EUC36383.1 hypothetical protein COCCADRAFT_2536 [Bipolaris zeicola 26-R-13]